MIDIKSETIAHYLRMRAWVLTQSPQNSVYTEDMKSHIGESWYGTYCDYCQHYDEHYVNEIDSEIECSSCILSHYDECGGEFNCIPAWYSMNTSNSWADWLKAWEQVVYYICVFG